jgi:hypothetical protein
MLIRKTTNVNYMEENTSDIKLTTKSYVLIIVSLLLIIAMKFSAEFVQRDVITYAFFNTIFYSTVTVMLFVVFSDVLGSAKNMQKNLKYKLKNRLYFVIFICMPLIAVFDMKSAMLSNNWVFVF